jgi:hypothetical protein
MVAVATGGTLGDISQTRRASSELPECPGVSKEDRQAWLEVETYLRNNPGKNMKDAYIATGVHWRRYNAIYARMVGHGDGGRAAKEKATARDRRQGDAEQGVEIAVARAKEAAKARLAEARQPEPEPEEEEEAEDEAEEDTEVEMTDEVELEEADDFASPTEVLAAVISALEKREAKERMRILAAVRAYFAA